MYRSKQLVRPGPPALLGALAVAVLAAAGSAATPVLGYPFALAALVMIIVVSLAESSIWPTRGHGQRPVIFALFWGLMVGVLLPYLVQLVFEGGFGAIMALVSDPA